MRRAGFLTALALLVLAGCGGSDETQPRPAVRAFDAQRALADLRAQVEIGPRPSDSAGGEKEVRFIVRRLREAGIDDVRVQRPWRNVVARLPGTEPGTVVAGAHHDTKEIPGFVGANDGASGVAVLLELARTLPRPLPGPAIDLVFFDAEESRGADSSTAAFARSGDRGSSQYVRYARAGGTHGSRPLEEVLAMVLFDMVGDCDLQIPHEATSDAALYDRFAAAAAAASPTGSSEPFVGRTGGIEDDHTPFQAAGVPAVDLIDFTYGPGGTPGAWWHTRADNLRHVCARSLAAVGEPALRALVAMTARTAPG